MRVLFRFLYKISFYRAKNNSFGFVFSYARNSRTSSTVIKTVNNILARAYCFTLA